MSKTLLLHFTRGVLLLNLMSEVFSLLIMLISFFSIVHLMFDPVIHFGDFNLNSFLMHVLLFGLRIGLFIQLILIVKRLPQIQRDSKRFWRSVDILRYVLLGLAILGLMTQFQLVSVATLFESWSAIATNAGNSGLYPGNAEWFISLWEIVGWPLYFLSSISLQFNGPVAIVIFLLLSFIKNVFRQNQQLREEIQTVI